MNYFRKALVLGGTSLPARILIDFKFKNGQSVRLSRSGLFKMYRPSPVFNIVSRGTAQLSAYGVAHQITFTALDCVQFDYDIPNLEFSGTLSWTQLLKCEVDPIVWTTEHGI
jgi:hypothetical protein